MKLNEVAHSASLAIFKDLVHEFGHTAMVAHLEDSDLQYGLNAFASFVNDGAEITMEQFHDRLDEVSRTANKIETATTAFFVEAMEIEDHGITITPTLHQARMALYSAQKLLETVQAERLGFRAVRNMLQLMHQTVHEDDGDGIDGYLLAIFEAACLKMFGKKLYT